jgi:hypothetical protein
MRPSEAFRRLGLSEKDHRISNKNLKREGLSVYHQIGDDERKFALRTTLAKRKEGT